MEFLTSHRSSAIVCAAEYSSPSLPAYGRELMAVEGRSPKRRFVGVYRRSRVGEETTLPPRAWKGDAD